MELLWGPVNLSRVNDVHLRKLFYGHPITDRIKIEIWKVIKSNVLRLINSTYRTLDQIATQRNQADSMANHCVKVKEISNEL
jgi:hypothetical protein